MMNNKSTSKSMIVVVVAALMAVVDHNQLVAESAAPATNQRATLARPHLFKGIEKRSADHHSMMHNHLSRKVMDRACAASKDTIDEIVACMTTSEGLTKAIKKETAATCYKEAFNQEFDEKDLHKHKELICNNRDKFENMTTCIYRKTSEQLDAKEMEKLTETLVDVGLCIINALDS